MKQLGFFVVGDSDAKFGEYKPRREPKPLTEVTKPGTNTNYESDEVSDMSFNKKGGAIKMASGGSASKRADGIAMKGKTRGKIC